MRIECSLAIHPRAHKLARLDDNNDIDNHNDNHNNDNDNDNDNNNSNNNHNDIALTCLHWQRLTTTATINASTASNFTSIIGSRRSQAYTMLVSGQ
jgi:hypothetical protein